MMVILGGGPQSLSASSWISLAVAY